MKRPSRVLLAVGAVAAILTIAPPVRAAVKSSGDAVLVGSNFKTIVTSGNSKTKFSLSLPAGASCPGDSASQQYRVQSFMVPVADDPGGLKYHDVGPIGEHAFGLFGLDTNSWTNQATQRADKPGDEGLIINIPPFDFSVFDPGMIVPGRYHVGIACSLFAETKRYWSADITVVTDPADKPAQISWKVIDPPTEKAKSQAGRTLLISVLVFAGIVASGVLLGRNRSRKPVAR